MEKLMTGTICVLAATLLVLAVAEASFAQMGLGGSPNSV